MIARKAEFVALSIIFSTLFAIVDPALPQPITLVNVGGSLTERDGEDGSAGEWPARLHTMLQDDHSGSTSSNCAISGDTPRI